MVCRLPSPPTVARGDDVLAEITGGQGLDPSVDLNADDGNDSLRTLVFLASRINNSAVVPISVRGNGIVIPQIQAEGNRGDDTIQDGEEDCR